MADEIDDIETLLDETARRCLRCIVDGDLDPDISKALAKWMYGCGNQRYAIRSRIEQRGKGELAKVLQFIAQACELLLEIERRE